MKEEVNTLLSSVLVQIKCVTCIDEIHVEKNMCDSLITTLLNIKGKTKMTSMLV